MVGGAILLAVGLGILCFGEVLMYEYQQLTIDTNIESVVKGDVPLHRTVRVSGELKESTFGIYEKEDEKIIKLFYTYDLSDEKDNYVLIKSDDPVSKIGEIVAVTGTLRYREYGYYGYLVDVKAEPPFSIRWIFIGFMLVFTLPGMVLLISGLKER